MPSAPVDCCAASCTSSAVLKIIQHAASNLSANICTTNLRMQNAWGIMMIAYGSLSALRIRLCSFLLRTCTGLLTRAQVVLSSEDLLNSIRDREMAMLDLLDSERPVAASLLL